VNRRPLVTATAAVGAVVLVAAAGSAGAATTSRPAVGRALSSLSLLQLSAAGHTVRLADVNLLSDTLSGTTSRIELVPVTADGTKLGRQVITPSDGSTSTPAVSTPGALAAIANITSPAIEAVATTKPTAHAGTTSLGSVKLFNLPIDLVGSLGADSGVDALTGAAGTKTVSLENVALPSIADLLGKLGLDVGALPIDTLNDLVDGLGLATGAVTTAQGAVDTAQAQLDAALATLATQTSALTAAQGQLATATSDLTAAADAVQDLLDTLPVPMQLATYVALVDKSPVDALEPALPAAYADYVTAQGAVTAAQAAVTAAQALVNTTQTLVTTLTSALDGVVATLSGLIEGVLDDTPLVSLGKLAVTTIASATSAKAGGQAAKVVGGEITGLKVLGTDVLDAVLGSTTVELTELVGSALTEVNAAIALLNGTLADILSNVPSLPALSVPTPVVKLLTKSTSTSVVDGFGKASATVKALSISIPGITVPSAVQVPNALNMPGISAAGVSDVLSSAVSLSMLTLTEQAAFRPAVIAPGSSTGGRTLPDTGAPVGLAVTALALVGTALVLRRRFLAEV
jgi:hypothetical protein